MEIKVLFVCLGNICRSPMAEGSFKNVVRAKGLESKIKCDSAGTSSYHIGAPPDRRMTETALQHGIVLNHAACQLTTADFDEFDYIVAMDFKNFENIQLLESKSDGGRATVLLMRDFDPAPDSKDVPDPYYGAMSGFEEVYQIVTRCSEKLLDHIIENNF